MAVLYRTNAQSRVLEESLRRNRIAYRWWVDSVFTRVRKFVTCWLTRGSPSIPRTQRRSSASSTPRRGGLALPRWGRLKRRPASGKLSLWEALEEELAARRLPGRALKALETFHALMKQLMAEHESLLMGQFFKSILDRTRLRGDSEAGKSAGIAGPH